MDVEKKEKIKKKLLLSLLAVSVLAGTAAMPVSAAETRAMPNGVVEAGTDMVVSGTDINSESISYGKPISESVYTDDDGINTGKGVKIKDVDTEKTKNSLKISFKATTSFGRTQKFSVSLKVNSKGKAS